MLTTADSKGHLICIFGVCTDNTVKQIYDYET